jgi:hypothetical protein
MLFPDSVEARLSYARVHRVMGFPLKYLMELIVLRDYYKSRDSRVLDDIEVLQNRYAESVAHRWADKLKPFRNEGELFDQFSIEKRTFSLAVWTESGANRLLHPTADADFSSFLRDLLLRFPAFSLEESDGDGRSFEEAFSAARGAGVDYFILLRYGENERSFVVEGRLYLARTGTLLKEFSVFRTGNNRVREALYRVSEQIRETFPLGGTILAREFDRGLINLGIMEGVATDNEFLIIKKGRLKYRTDRVDFLYQEDDVLGRIRITQTDENLSEGTILPSTFFDRINPGDEVVMVAVSKP